MQPLFLGNHSVIDFLNTSFAPDGHTTEVLIDGKAYVEWLVAARLLSEAQASTVTRRFGAKAVDGAAAEARRVREWMREWLTRWRTHPRSNYAEELAALNRLLARDYQHAEVVGSKGEFKIVERREPEAATDLLGLIALKCADLITHRQADLVKVCASDTCTLWFLDTTKSHRRLFCSPTACGNRAKVAAFRERQRK